MYPGTIKTRADIYTLNDRYQASIGKIPDLNRKNQDKI